MQAETRTVIGVDKSGDRVRQMFASIAPRYDFMNHLLSMNVDRYWRWRTIRQVPPAGPEPILDVCTGTGDLAFAFWRAGGGQTPVIASDFCREMLEIGRRKQAKAGIGETLEFVEADATDLPFPDDTFQVVSAAFGLRNVFDTDQGLREMARVCRPGGRLAILEFSMPRHQPFRAIYRWYFRNVLPRVGQWLARNDDAAYEYLPASVQEFPDGDALAAKIRTAGLRDVEFYPLTFGIATLYIGTK